VESNWDQVTETFDDMNLRDELLRGIYAYGFEKPSAIQQRGIIPIIKGYDCISQAQSGTGKTATFSIAILQSLDLSLKECQAMILAPTRELALQIQKVCDKHKILTCLLLIIYRLFLHLETICKLIATHVSEALVCAMTLSACKQVFTWLSVPQAVSMT